MAVFFVTDASGDELFLDWSGGSTSTLYHNIGGPDEIPAPIYYDEGQTAPVADGSYIVEPDDNSTSLLIQVSNGIVTQITERLVQMDSGSGSGDAIFDNVTPDIGLIPSCLNLTAQVSENPQALVDAVKSELRKLRNNPNAFGAITNRITYLLMNGQAAPRNYKTKFVKPISVISQAVNSVQGELKSPGRFPVSSGSGIGQVGP